VLEELVEMLVFEVQLYPDYMVESIQEYERELPSSYLQSYLHRTG